MTLYEQAEKLVMSRNRASAAMVQRVLHISYAEASDLIQEMVRRGSVLVTSTGWQVARRAA